MMTKNSVLFFAKIAYITSVAKKRLFKSLREISRVSKEPCIRVGAHETNAQKKLLIIGQLLQQLTCIKKNAWNYLIKRNILATMIHSIRMRLYRNEKKFLSWYLSRLSRFILPLQRNF